MQRIWYVLLLMSGLALFSSNAMAQNVVVLTKTPVESFTLPDGSELKNAYVWKKNSQGLMIIHDGGNYFLNFQSMPDDWKAAYQGKRATTASAATSTASTTSASSKPINDRYGAADVLKNIPYLMDETRDALLTDPSLRGYLFAICLLHTNLEGSKKEISHFNILLEESGVEFALIDPEHINPTCIACDGEGFNERSCPDCRATGECAKCKDDDDGKKKSKKGKDEKKKPKGLSVDIHDCSACEDSGECATCKGEKKVKVRCARCKGVGTTRNKTYCTTIRDYLVRKVNKMTLPKQSFSILAHDESMQKAFSALPEISPAAEKYYLSDQYMGESDHTIIAACLLQALLNRETVPTRTFHYLVQLEEQKGDSEFPIESYFPECETCERTGVVFPDCEACEGTGHCARCEGYGKFKTEIGDDRIHCTTCRGKGLCTTCKGYKTIKTTCRECKGAGFVVQVQRCEIKRDLLIDELNDYKSNLIAQPEL